MFSAIFELVSEISQFGPTGNITSTPQQAVFLQAQNFSIMLSQETRDYCTKAEAGLATIIGEDIPSVFNRFSNLYTIYNRLYNEVPAALTSAGVVLPKKKEDNKKATEFVVQYIGATNLLSNLIAHGAEDDIETLSWILELGAFHIKLKDGLHDAARDAELKRDIKSVDPITKAHAILYVIYYVRCNMVHGEKHQDDHQRLLVSAVTRILRIVKDQLHSLLDKV
jgi:hypothetical protein